MSDPSAHALVDFAQALSMDHVPPGASHAARQRFVDTLACAVGGYGSPPAQAARAMAYPVEGDGTATIWGSRLRTTPEAAAFANGVALRYLDLNDTYKGRAGGCHPSDMLAALVAAGEMVDADAEALLLGTIVAYEVMAAVSDEVCFNDFHLDSTVTISMAAALGCAKILDLTTEESHYALSLAVVPNLALLVSRLGGELSHWKGAAAGLAAARGLEAARLAGCGMEAPPDPFHGRNGLWEALGEAHEVAPLSLRPDVFGISQSNVKRWPVRDSCQLPINAALKLRGGLPDVRDLAGLKVETYAACFKTAAEAPELWYPTTRETADHSLPFSVAIALLDGDVSQKTFTEERYLDEDLRSLMDLMTVEVNDDFTAQTPEVKNSRVTATLPDGSSRTTSHSLSRSEIEAGFPDEFFAEKFQREAGPRLGTTKASALLDELWTLDRDTMVRALVARWQWE